MTDEFNYAAEGEGEGDKPCPKSRKDTGSKVDPFKEYKNSSKFPYKLHLADYEGRCAICYKFLKLVVFKG